MNKEFFKALESHAESSRALILDLLLKVDEGELDHFLLAAFLSDTKYLTAVLKENSDRDKPE